MVMASSSSRTCVEVEAMERSVRQRVPPLLTDLYQFTMAYAYWRTGRHREPAVFELFFRNSPFDGGFALFVGLHDCQLFLRSFRFSLQGKKVTCTQRFVCYNAFFLTLRDTESFAQPSYVNSLRAPAFGLHSVTVCS